MSTRVRLRPGRLDSRSARRLLAGAVLLGVTSCTAAHAPAELAAVTVDASSQPTSVPSSPAAALTATTTTPSASPSPKTTPSAAALRPASTTGTPGAVPSPTPSHSPASAGASPAPGLCRLLSAETVSAALGVARRDVGACLHTGSGTEGSYAVLVAHHTDRYDAAAVYFLPDPGGQLWQGLRSDPARERQTIGDVACVRAPGPISAPLLCSTGDGRLVGVEVQPSATSHSATAARAATLALARVVLPSTRS